MNYEKKYKDSLLAMKRMVEAGIIEECYAKDIFSELRESEDERIRKKIIEHFSDIIDYDNARPEDIPESSEIKSEKDFCRKAIAWLEKQGEQYYSCESDIDFKIEADKWYVCIKDYYYSDIDELMFTKGKAYKAYIDWGFICNNGKKKTPIGLFPYKEYFRPATDEEIPHEQKPAELNDDDKQYLLVCKNALYKYQVSDKWDANIIYQWLEDKVKSLKDRVGCEVNCTTTKECSEEVEAAISLLKHIAEEQEKDYCPHNANDLRKTAQYLETCRPQNRWKPNDAQMASITCAVRKMKESACYDSELVSLLNDLKKLKG